MPDQPSSLTPGGDILPLASIVLSGTATTRDEAIEEAGTLLVATGSVDATYVASMHVREQAVSTYLGDFLAVPHGTNDAGANVRFPSIAFVRYPDSIEWNGNPVRFVVALAAVGADQLALVSRIATVFLDRFKVIRLEKATTVAQVAALLAPISA